MNKFKFLLTVLLLLSKSLVLGQSLSTDDKLRISLNNALIGTHRFIPYSNTIIIQSSSLERFNNDISVFLLRNHSILSLVGHRITISAAPYTNKWGEDVLIEAPKIRYTVTITKVQNSSDYELRIDNIAKRWFSIVFGSSEKGPYKYYDYSSGDLRSNESVIKIMPSADGQLRANRFDTSGRLRGVGTPVVLDEYGRIIRKISKDLYTINTTYAYTADHNFASQFESYLNISDYERIVGNNQKLVVSSGAGDVYLKRGYMDEVEYFDMYQPDNTRPSGIRMLYRIYIHWDRDDLDADGYVRHITKKSQEKARLEKEKVEAAKREAALREAQKRKEEAQRKAEELRKEERRMQEVAERIRKRLYAPKIEAVTVNDSVIKGFETEYPEIYSVYSEYVSTSVMKGFVQHLESLSLGELDEYLSVQNKTLVLLNDKKRCKQLKRALKKVISDHEKERVFRSFL